VDEFSDFKAAMSGVTPLKVDKKVDLVKNKQSSASIAQRRQDATQSTDSITNHLSDDYVHMVQPYDILSYRRDGLQDGVFRKFRLGKYTIDARLDLHKKTVNQARADIYEFIEDATKYDLRNLMILHGKGEKETTPALLKSWVNKWLPQMEDVLAFHSCQQRHGGTGAVYVMLRKSEKQKQQTRDQLGIK
jgi:DNA-nicking Smr family endonuclease